MSNSSKSEDLKVIQEPKRTKTKQKHQKDSAILKESIKSGKSIEQAAKLMKCNLYYAYKIRRESIQNGTWFTAEELQAIQEPKRAETSQKHQKDSATLKESIKSGESMKQAAELMKCSLYYAYKIRRESIQDGTWFDSEELKVIREQESRRQKETRKTKISQKHQKDSAILKEYIKGGKSMKQAAELMHYGTNYIYIISKESIQNGTWFTPEELRAIQKAKTRQRHQEDLETLKEYIKSGKSIKQAAELMKCSINYVYTIRRESIQNGTWFNSEELKVSQEPEEWRIRHKRQEGDTYIKYRKAAKKEENLELAGKENVSTEGRREFIELLTTLNDSETNISDEDIELVVNAFYMHPEIANKSSIKFLISVANKKGDLKLTLNIVNELTNALQDTEFGNPLSEYRREIKKMEKLEITSAEWNGIFYNSKKPDFGDR